MLNELHDLIDLHTYPIRQADFQLTCKQRLDDQGVLVLPGFILPAAIRQIKV